MFKKKLAVTILGALMFSPVILPPNNLLPAPVVCAEVKTIEADGYYIMGDGTEENQAVAKERARADAKRAASEKACTFVESISEIKNNNLTRDEIYTISASILKVISDPVNPEISGGSIMFHCRITVAVDTSNVEKFLHDRQKLDEATRQLKELRAENERLQAEINNLNKKFATASAEEKKEINAEIKRNEENFTAAQWVDKSYNFSMSGDYNKAIECANKAIQLNPENDKAWNNLGAAYYYLKNYNKAIEYANKASQLNPKNDSAWNNLGNAYSSLGDYNKAIEYLNKAIQLNSKNASAWNNLGLTYYSLGDYNKTIEYCNKAIQLNPKNDSAWNNLGFAYKNLGNYDKSIEYLNKAIQLNPKSYSALNNLGWVYNELGDYNKAIEYLNKAIQLNPKNDMAWNNLGVAYYYLKNYNKALDCFNKAVELNPNDADYKKYRDIVLAKMN